MLEYLGRYTHRVAISNSRLIKVDKKNVSLHWKDYADANKNKVMTLNACILRLLVHKDLQGKGIGTKLWRI